MDPESLLKQISALSVGQIVTHDAGNDLSMRPDLQALSYTFESI